MAPPSPQPSPCHIISSNALPTSSELHHVIEFIEDQKVKEEECLGRIIRLEARRAKLSKEIRLYRDQRRVIRRRTIEDKKAKAKECLGHITRLKAHRDKLLEEIQSHRHQQRAIRSKIAEHERVLAPFRRLHAHVLSEIFSFCALNEPLRGPIRISAVCRIWRTAALSTPRVWRHICVDFKSPFAEEVCQTWASRSGTRPLQITFQNSTWPRSWRFGHRRAVIDIVKAIGPNISRCEKISVCSCPVEGNDSILQALQSCSRLRDVTLSFSSDLGEASVIEGFIPSQGIENLEIRGVDDSRLRLFAPPFTSLRRLVLHDSDYTSVAMLRRILSNATLLEECVAHIGSGETLTTTTKAVTGLPHLQKLQLSSFDEVHIGVSLLQHLYLPELSSLDLDCALEGLDTPDWPHLHTLLSRSKPPLKRLSIRSIEAPAFRLHESLLVATTIEDIVLERVPQVNELLGWLAQPCHDGDPMSILCPHLESLEIKECAGVELRAICDFVDMRMPPQDYLQPRAPTKVDSNMRFLQPACHGNPALVTRFFMRGCDIRKESEQSNWICDRLNNTGVQWDVEWKLWVQSDDEDEDMLYGEPYSPYHSGLGWSDGFYVDSGPDTELEEYFDLCGSD